MQVPRTKGNVMEQQAGADDVEAVAQQLAADTLRLQEQLRSGQFENYVPDSREAKYKYGVLYQGEFETPSDGTATAVRLHARALAAAGVPVLLRSFSSVVVNQYGVADPAHIVGIPEEVEKEVGHLCQTDIAQLAPTIKHAVIRSAEHARQLLMPRGAVPIDMQDVEQTMSVRSHIYDNTIAYTVWERDRIDPGVAQHLARVKQCWVPCEMNRALLERSGVPADRIHVVPHPYDPQDIIPALQNRLPGHHRGKKRFYSIGRWEPRKGFDALIGAFLLAYAPGDDATLTIKYSGGGDWPGYVLPKEAVEYWTARFRGKGWTAERVHQHVTILTGRMPRSKIAQLHYDNNVYVSASHGEAWNLPAAEARIAGNRLVYVPYGGERDFASDDDIAVPCAMGPADASYQWERGAEWAIYRLEDLADALRRARPPETFRARGIERFTLEAVGQQMKQLVQLAVRGRPGMEECYR